MLSPHFAHNNHHHDFHGAMVCTDAVSVGNTASWADATCGSGGDTGGSGGGGGCSRGGGGGGDSGGGGC